MEHMDQVFYAATNSIAILLCLISYGVLSLIIFQQWRMIQNLNDRLMAGSYREYKTTVTPEPVRKHPEEKKAKFYDSVLG